MRNKILTAPLRFYKFFISPLIGQNCRFHPSCSCYAREAIEKHGAAKGIMLATRRIMRCHPWQRSANFNDPVPGTIDWRGIFRYKRQIH